MLDDPNENPPENQPPNDPPANDPPSTNVPDTEQLRKELQELQGRQVQELHQQNQELLARINSANATIEGLKKAGAPPEDPSSFLTKPRETMTEIIDERLKATVEPLVAFVNDLKKQSSYEKMRDQIVASRPEIKRAYDEVKVFVDDAMSRVPDPTPAVFNQVLFSVYGAKHLGVLPGSTPTPPNNNEPPSNLTPPNLRPSPPTPPKKPGENELRQLTESEENYRRKWNLTHKEFLELLESDGSVSRTK